MTSFIETQFPSNISYGAVGGPMFSTDIITNFGGYEQRNANWSAPLRQWNVAHGVRTEEQLNELIAFFHVMQGKSTGFRFKDWSDYSVTGQVIGTGDDRTLDFQLIKTYQLASHHYMRSITKPVATTLHVRVDDVLQEIETDYTLDSSTGVISFIDAPAEDVAIEIDTEFDVPARFDTDKMDVSLDSFQLGSWSNIPVMELRL